MLGRKKGNVTGKRKGRWQTSLKGSERKDKMKRKRRNEWTEQKRVEGYQKGATAVSF